MLRFVLFGALMMGGVVLFQSMDSLPQDEAWLVSGVIAAIVLFAIPPERGKRELRDLTDILIGVVGLYGICLKFRPWLATLIDRRVATLISVLLALGFVVAIFVAYAMRRTTTQTQNAK